ncbi:MAG: hypothetical protein SPJ19_02060 [Candidatus Borkfalkiaceae bacterium]|nr:hypothetical protein [Christensenellaceae bacterium]
MKQQNKELAKEEKNYKQNQNYNAFIGMMAQLMQKYGESVLKGIDEKQEVKSEQGGKKMFFIFSCKYGNAS